VAMLLAVLEKRARVPVGGKDVYAATVGGARLGEPAADLSIAVAMASAAHERSVPASMVALGEVGLAGELRRVPGLQRRLEEAARLGFTRAIVPADAGVAPAKTDRIPGLAVYAAPDLWEALHLLRLTD
jgi:DNA repair protein RadA/Sms